MKVTRLVVKSLASSTRGATRKKMNIKIAAPKQGSAGSTPWEGAVSPLVPPSNVPPKKARKAPTANAPSQVGKRVADLLGAGLREGTVDAPPTDEELSDRVQNLFNGKVFKEESNLTMDQQKVLQMAVEGASLFIGGKAGTGKSHLLREICSALQKKGLDVAITASTGVASLNIGGNTFHSTLGVPVLGGGLNTSDQLDETDVKPGGYKRFCFNEQLLSTVDVIVIDEVSLLHAGYLECLNQNARRCENRDKSKYFGGIQVILSGDFLQLTPFDATDQSESLVCQGVEDEFVVHPVNKVHRVPMDGAAKKASQKTMREYFKLPMYESACFQKAFLHVQLLEPARQQGDPVFVEELNLLRCGRLPHRISRSAHLNPVEPDAVRLFSVRHAVKNYNDAKMMFLKGAPMTFKSDVSLHSVDSEENLHYSEILLLMFQKATKRKKKASATRQQKVTLKEVREFLSTSLGVSKGDMHKVSLYVLPTVHISFTAVPRVALRCSGRSPEDVNRLYHSLAGKVSQWIQQHGDLATVLTSGVVDLPDHAKLSVVRCDTVSPRDLVQKMKTPVQASFLKSMKKDFILQSKVLKVGCRVMLLRNLNAVLVNGSIGTVERFLPLSKCGPLLPDNVRATLSQPCARLYNRLHFGNNETEATHLDQPRVAEANLKGVHQTSALSYDPVLPIVVMDATGARVAIPWISLPLPSALYDGFFVGRINCMPLTPAYAFTVHKIQGLTLSTPILFDAKDTFPCHHLVYVAASRVKSFSQLRILNLSPPLISVHIPSLQFSESVPDVSTVYAQWKSWTSGECKTISSKQISLPLWKDQNA